MILFEKLVDIFPFSPLLRKFSLKQFSLSSPPLLCACSTTTPASLLYPKQPNKQLSMTNILICGPRETGKKAIMKAFGGVSKIQENSMLFSFSLLFAYRKI